MALESGSQLGPYEILAPLGAVGMGDVYRARDPRLDREVAIKVLPAAASADPERLRRFEQEARAAGALNHPNILVIYDIGMHEGAPYIVSELLEGETLRERLRSDSKPASSAPRVASEVSERTAPPAAALSQRKAIHYATQIAQGLAAAHEKGIVHRDLKPENLFITRDGHVKILDFGLAKLTQPVESEASMTALATSPPATEPGMVLGTVGYMSPEQVTGGEMDASSDLFSLGILLYLMLTGEKPFSGDTAAVMFKIAYQDPAPPSQIKPELGRGHDFLLLRALAVIALIAANAFFVASEFALVASRRTRIEAMVRKGDRKAKTVQTALQDLYFQLSAVQLGITLASILLGYVAEETTVVLLRGWFEGVPWPAAFISRAAIAPNMTSRTAPSSGSITLVSQA